MSNRPFTNATLSGTYIVVYQGNSASFTTFNQISGSGFAQ